MTPRATTAHRTSLVDSVAHQLHSWKPFQLHQTLTLEAHPSKPYYFPTKKPCRSDRSTAPPIRSSPDAGLDLSRLSLMDEGNPPSRHRDDALIVQDGYKSWLARKRRRRGGSRSVSGRSSDRSRHRTYPTTAGAATCSDYSSGELMSWGSDASEAAARFSRRGDGRGDGSLVFGVSERGGGELGLGLGLSGQGGGNGLAQQEGQGNESGYGSEPGYRGDGEFGYGDEFDDDDEFDARQMLFWSDQRIRDVNQIGDGDKNKFGEQKNHHRCRRKKHDFKIMAPLR